MESTHKEIIKQTPAGEVVAGDGSPITRIGSETVLSRLPIHNLAKKGNVNIQIVSKNEDGVVTLQWEVSHSERYGQPRAAAYKLDTIVINRRIDEQRRPLPKMICLGSLREIAEELDLGGDTNLVRRAMRQNAFAAITAKLTYTGADGVKRRLEADFTRYSVIFTGEKMPDGRRADAVYIILNEPYREVLDHAPVRPLNYDYLKVLPPAAQRFYEIVSYRIFAALSNKRGAEAILPYSEYCMCSAQQRYLDYDHFKKQMYKVHRLHLQSGYLKSIRYVAGHDASGQPDWKMHYTPGPRAEAEFHAFSGRRGQRNPSGIQQAITREVGEWAPQPKGAPGPEGRSDREQSTAAMRLVQHFHRRERGIENYPVATGGKECNQANDLVSAYGEDGARFIVDFAVAEAEKTNFKMRVFGGLLQYVPEAAIALDWRKSANAVDAERDRAEADRKEKIREHYEAGKQLLTGLAPEARLALYAQVKAEFQSRWSGGRVGESSFFERMIENAMIAKLMGSSHEV
jgi:hypothetical protein